MTSLSPALIDRCRALHVALLLLAIIYAVLAYQKYRFQNGFALGVSLAAIAVYTASGRRLGLGAASLEKALVGVLAAAVTIGLQRLCK